MKTKNFLIAVISITVVMNARAVSKPINLSQKIDSIISLQHTAGQPGGVIGVISGSDVVVKKSFGIMDVENNKAITETTLFDIASVAKQFTAFAILLLEQDGKIELDRDIRYYLPDMPDYGHIITVRHLMQHTSGVASTDWLRLLSGIPFDVKWTQQDEIDIIYKYSCLNFEPNTKHVYSNSGYSLLAEIVNSASGMPLPGFLKKNVFTPLSMETAIIYYSPDIEQKNTAFGYEMLDDKAVLISSSEDYSYGQGNIFASLNDMINWGQNFITPKVGGHELVNRMLTKYNTLENGDSLSYTYGFYVSTYKGVKMVSHSGGIPGFRSRITIFPDDELVVITMLNNESINSRAIATGVAELFLADRIFVKEVAPRIAVDLNYEKIEKYAGNYKMPDGMELEFAFELDTFWLLLPGDQKFELFAESDNEFFLKDFDAQVTFIDGSDGEVNEIIWHQGGNDYHASRTSEKVLLSIEEIASFAGDYYHPDLSTDYNVIFEDEQLKIIPPATFERYFRASIIPLNHVNGNIFATDRFGMVEFTRNSDKDVIGFVMLDIGRLQNVKFVRR
ncbi:MAG: serine hydrolase [Bacteroidota bacterium]